MSTNPARWRGRRRLGFTQLVDQALEVTFDSEDDNWLPASEADGTPRLARGICWSDLVAEMKRDWAAGEHREAA